VINKRIVAATLVLFSTAVFTAAQASQGAGQPQNPGAQTPSTTAQEPTTTLVGCLYREDQVPGRKPNIAEKASVLEDYILADASVPSSKVEPGATPGATGTTGAVPTQGNMFKVENIPGGRLKALVGKRVEVSGKIDPEGSPATTRPGETGAPTPDRGLGPDEINLPEFEAASIREVPGEKCPAAPAPRK
jgi:hypothetical protein